MPMLVSDGQGFMHLQVTYGVCRISCVVCFCCVRCTLFQAANRSVVLLFPPPFPPSLVGFVSIGLVSISTDLVSVMVPGCRSQSCRGCLSALLRACGSRLVACPGITAHFGRHHLQAHLLAMSLTWV